MRPQMENIQKSGWRSIAGKIKKRSWIILSLVLTVILLFTISAQAMTSTNYKLDWYVPLSGGGGRCQFGQLCHRLHGWSDCQWQRRQHKLQCRIGILDGGVAEVDLLAADI